MQRIAGSPWAVLGLDEGASLEEVRHAFRVAAKQTHPDRGGDRSAFEAVRAAFEAAAPLARRTRAAAATAPRWAANPYAWCDRPVSPQPTPTFQPPRRPQPRPRPRPYTNRSKSGEAFAAVLQETLAAA